MKRTLLILCLFCLSFSRAQTVVSSCSLNDTIASAYKKDADRLAVRRVYHINSTYKDTVKINKTISTSYLKALIAVYNATTLPARDTVIKRCNIHTKADPDLNGFSIAADSNLTWMKNIRNNVSPIGNTLIDNAINKYGFQKIQFQALSLPYHLTIFKADSNINTLPLGIIVTAIQGVYAAGPDAVPFDGPNIVDSVNTNFIDLIYYYGWNDCALGCTYRRFWTFRVYNDCSVEYKGDYGDPLPAWVGIKKERIFENLKIFPNPTSNKIIVDLGTIRGNTVNLIITNTLGQNLYREVANSQIQEVDLTFLAHGLYYLNVQNDSGQKVFKIVKE